MKAADVMVRNVITVGPDACVQDVAHILLTPVHSPTLKQIRQSASGAMFPPSIIPARHVKSLFPE